MSQAQSGVTKFTGLEGDGFPFCQKCKHVVDNIDVENHLEKIPYGPYDVRWFDTGGRTVKISCHGETAIFYCDALGNWFECLK